jgi:hypothetical protein
MSPPSGSHPCTLPPAMPRSSSAPLSSDHLACGAAAHAVSLATPGDDRIREEIRGAARPPRRVRQITGHGSAPGAHEHPKQRPRGTAGRR